MSVPWVRSLDTDNARNFDSAELQKAWLSLRPEKENTAAQKLQEAYEGQYDSVIMSEAKQDISKFLNEKNEKHSALESIHRPNTERKNTKVSQQAER